MVLEINNFPLSRITGGPEAVVLHAFVCFSSPPSAELVHFDRIQQLALFEPFIRTKRTLQLQIDIRFVPPVGTTPCYASFAGTAFDYFAMQMGLAELILAIESFYRENFFAIELRDGIIRIAFFVSFR